MNAEQSLELGRQFIKAIEAIAPDYKVASFYIGATVSEGPGTGTYPVCVFITINPAFEGNAADTTMRKAFFESVNFLQGQLGVALLRKEPFTPRNKQGNE